MVKDVECPYCEEWQEINHDDGNGYTEDELCEQECSDCEKTFTFYTSISFHYSSQKADCLNGGEHKHELTKTYPVEFARFVCVDCEDELPPTKKMIQARELYFKNLHKDKATG